jgi:hypothetical protein
LKENLEEQDADGKFRREVRDNIKTYLKNKMGESKLD